MRIFHSETTEGTNHSKAFSYKSPLRHVQVEYHMFPAYNTNRKKINSCILLVFHYRLLQGAPLSSTNILLTLKGFRYYKYFLKQFLLAKALCQTPPNINKREGRLPNREETTLKLTKNPIEHTSVIDDFCSKHWGHLQNCDEGLVHGCQWEWRHAMSSCYLGDVNSTVTCNGKEQIHVVMLI